MASRTAFEKMVNAGLRISLQTPERQVFSRVKRTAEDAAADEEVAMDITMPETFKVVLEYSIRGSKNEPRVVFKKPSKAAQGPGGFGGAEGGEAGEAAEPLREFVSLNSPQAGAARPRPRPSVFNFSCNYIVTLSYIS